jgi:hypothetical protein
MHQNQLGRVTSFFTFSASSETEKRIWMQHLRTQQRAHQPQPQQGSDRGVISRKRSETCPIQPVIRNPASFPSPNTVVQTLNENLIEDSVTPTPQASGFATPADLHEISGPSLKTVMIEHSFSPQADEDVIQDVGLVRPSTGLGRLRAPSTGLSPKRIMRRSSSESDQPIPLSTLRRSVQALAKPDTDASPLSPSHRLRSRCIENGTPGDLQSNSSVSPSQPVLRPPSLDPIAATRQISNSSMPSPARRSHPAFNFALHSTSMPSPRFSPHSPKFSLHTDSEDDAFSNYKSSLL